MVFLFQVAKNAVKENDPIGKLLALQGITEKNHAVQVLVERANGDYYIGQISSVKKGSDGKTQVKFLNDPKGLWDVKHMIVKRAMPEDAVDIHNLESGKTKIGFEMEDGKKISGTFESYYSGTGKLGEAMLSGFGKNTYFFRIETEFGTQDVYAKDIKKILISH